MTRSHERTQNETRSHLLRVEALLAALEDGAQALALAVAQLDDAPAALLAQPLARRLRLPVRLLQRGHPPPLLLLEPARTHTRNALTRMSIHWSWNLFELDWNREIWLININLCRDYAIREEKKTGWKGIDCVNLRKKMQKLLPAISIIWSGNWGKVTQGKLDTSEYTGRVFAELAELVLAQSRRDASQSQETL